jgi:phage FluMu protein Com
MLKKFIPSKVKCPRCKKMIIVEEIDFSKVDKKFLKSLLSKIK